MEREIRKGTQATLKTADEDIFIPTRLDQLETLGKYSVVYEIARIDAILSLTFVQDLSNRFLTAPAT